MDVAEALSILEEITETRGGTPTAVPVPTHADRLGRYVLRFALASGGMATVYLAVAKGASGFGRVVAVKRIHPHLEDESAFVEMFLDEARIASRIRHPNVCSVEDFGQSDGSYYMTMEYLVGESLSHVAKQLGTMPPAIAARIVADACEGLHAAHELEGDDGEPLGVVHRDVSPQNLFVGYDGIVKVVDFGIAKANRRVHQTATGMVKGKFAYMPIEQLRGECVDRRADVWALGVVLWELVAGQKLFRRRNESETIMAVQRRVIPELAALRPGTPEGLDEIVRRALSEDPADRFPTARAMGLALSRLFAGPHAADTPEISDMMGRLFERRCEAQRSLIRSALSSPTPESHRLHPRLDLPDSDERSRSGIVLRRGRVRSRLSPMVMAFAAAFVATSVVGGAYLLLRDAPSDPAMAEPVASDTSSP